jgi:hypothetical protein
MSIFFMALLKFELQHQHGHADYHIVHAFMVATFLVAHEIRLWQHPSQISTTTFVWLHFNVSMKFVSGQPGQWFAAGCQGRKQTLILPLLMSVVSSVNYA